MNAALIAGFALGLAGVIIQNAWYYWHLRRLAVLAYTLETAGALVIAWGADKAHRSVTAVLVFAAAVLAVAGSLAFVAFMAEVKHQGWVQVVKRMKAKGPQS